ncbi:hypothetical protein [Schlesneria paludicola]|uniref:hypothetical protein n=1 Tax=Schlesneria paludicola TaxID=360056 RepID=UPI0002FF007F|nr:hypothetical protein [Schlesneria paludicola]
MRNFLQPCMAFISPWVIAGGLIGGPSDAIADATQQSKPRKAVRVSRRTSRVDDAIVQVSGTSTDEDFFDRALLPASSIVPFEGTSSQNCTTGTNGLSQQQCVPGGMPGTTPGAMPPATNPQPTLDTPSGLSDPDSVFPRSPEPPSPAMNPITSLSAGQGASTAASYVPAFMGDFFGQGSTVICNNGNAYGGDGGGFLAGKGSVSVATSTPVGIMKLAENTSPLPRDRVFLSYNYFSNVRLTPDGIPVNRLTPGVEKTFFNGNASVEVRVPMALTLGSGTTIGQGYDTNQYELGNLTTFFKGLLYRDEQYAWSAGFGVAAPTANGTTLFDAQGATVAQINNQAWHALPFLGCVYTPNDRFFAQGLFQFDFATNGNSVYTQNDSQVLQKDGILTDPAYMFTSFGAGYWMYQSPDPTSRLTRIALLTELHINRTLQSTDSVQGTQVNTGVRQDPFRTVNALVGTNIMLGQTNSLLLGYVFPMDGGQRVFDGEFRVLFNWYFGGVPNRATRVQF